jgi:WD40 repeat protein
MHSENRNRRRNRSLKVRGNKKEKVKNAFSRKNTTIGRLAEEWGYSRDTLSRFFNGHSVDRTTFEEICSELGLDWQDVADVEEPEIRQDWGTAPDVLSLVGRDRELHTLKQWITTDRCRLVSILGMGGLGKTSLGTLAAKTFVHDFQYVIWRSLLNRPPLEQILLSLIQFVSNEKESKLPETSDAQLELLLHYLKEHRCLIVIDNLERILEGEFPHVVYRSGYEEYGQFLKVVGQTAHQSCFLLTSREEPQELSQLEQLESVRTLNLGGLPALEARNIFTTIGSFSIKLNDEWNKLVAFYNGNPLALTFVARHIKEVFFSSITAFLEAEKHLFPDIWQLINEHFERLTEEEKELLFWLAVVSEPMSSTDLKANILIRARKDAVESTLKLLARRIPLEKQEADRTFSLQPMLIEFMLEKLVQQACEELLDKNMALLKSHALLKAEAKEYVRETQTRLIVKAIIERLSPRFSSNEVLAAYLQDVLSSLRDRSKHQAGYAPGNIINLLCCLNNTNSKITLRGADFSRLYIREAYLQKTELQEANFSNSSFVNSTFTQSFGTIMSVAFSVDGEHLAIGEGDGVIQIWDIRSSQLIRLLRGNENDRIWSLAFSPRNMLASGSESKAIRLWNIQTGQCLKTLYDHQMVMAVAFSPNGEIVASGSAYRTIKLWKVKTGECIKVLQGHASLVLSVAFSRNGELLVSSSYDRTVRLWDVHTGECVRVLKEATDALWSVAFSPNSQLIAGGCDDQVVRLWDVETGKCTRTLQGHTDRIRAIAFNNDGTVLASGSGDRTLKLWSVETGKCYKTLTGHTNMLQAIAFHLNGKLIASGGYDQTVRVWDAQTGQTLRVLQGYSNWVMAVACHPRVEIFATGGSDGTIKLWDTSTGTYLTSLQRHAEWVISIAFSPDGEILAGGCDDQTIRFWRLHRRGEYRPDAMSMTGHANWVRSLAFSPDGQRLVSGGEDKTVKVWDVRKGECLLTLQTQGSVWSVAFSPDGEMVAGAGEDGIVWIWNPHTGRSMINFKGHTNIIGTVTFSPDSKMLVSACGDQTIRIWDTYQGTCFRTFQDDNLVMAAAFSPDGQRIASGNGNGFLKLWDVATGECLYALQGHTSWIRSIAFSPDGTKIITGGNDSIIRVWNTATNQCHQVLRAERPYERMNITGVTGLTQSQLQSLQTLGAFD